MDRRRAKLRDVQLSLSFKISVLKRKLFSYESDLEPTLGLISQHQLPRFQPLVLGRINLNPVVETNLFQ